MAPAGSGDRLPEEAQEWKKPGGWRRPLGKKQMNRALEKGLSLSVWYGCFGNLMGSVDFLETRICINVGGSAHNLRDV